MTHQDVQGWLDRYVAAWRSYDPAAIGDLFSDDATYRYHPWDEPLRGRQAIVDDWLQPNGDAAQRDRPGTFDATYRPYAVDDRQAVAVGMSEYLEGPGGPLARSYHNVFLLAFDDEGRCSDFTELYMQAARR
jgi:hypothetical protein